MLNFDAEDIIIITGASSGIGKSITLLLNDLGAYTIAIGRNEESLIEVKSNATHPENFAFELKDLSTDIENLPQYLKELKEKYGKFHGLVCCAGISEIEPLQMLDLKKLKQMFDINCFSPLFLAKGFADKRVNRGKGSSIVLVSSTASIQNDKGQIAYSSSKAAASAGFRCIAREISSKGIRVNVVSPSDIKTPMHEKLNNYRQTPEEKYPLGLGDASDVASFVSFLLSDDAKWLNCQNYTIDCGSF